MIRLPEGTRLMLGLVCGPDEGDTYARRAHTTLLIYGTELNLSPELEPPKEMGHQSLP